MKFAPGVSTSAKYSACVACSRIVFVGGFRGLVVGGFEVLPSKPGEQYPAFLSKQEFATYCKNLLRDEAEGRRKTISDVEE